MELEHLSLQWNREWGSVTSYNRQSKLDCSSQALALYIHNLTFDARVCYSFKVHAEELYVQYIFIAWVLNLLAQWRASCAWNISYL